MRQSSLSFSALALLVIGAIVVVGDGFFNSSTALPVVDAENVLVTSAAGMAQFILAAGSWWVTVYCLWPLLSTRQSSLGQSTLGHSKPGGLTKGRLQSFAILPLFFALLLVATNQSFSTGRPILAAGLLMPGSAATHLMLWTTKPWLHRIFEPLWVLLLGSLVLAGPCMRLSTLSFSALLIFECLVLIFLAPSGLSLSGAERIFSWLHYLLTIGALVSTLVSLQSYKAERDEVVNSSLLRRTTTFVLGIISAAAVLAVVAVARHAPQIKLGAHYYTWFPENWSHGYAAQESVPKVEPMMGEYSLRDSSVFLQHEWWAREGKLDYLILDWWPTRARLQRRIKDYLGASASQLSSLKISLHYELLDLRQIDKRAIPGEPSYVVTLTPSRVEKLRDDLLMLAQDFMSQPYYLRINNRPVIFFYATRHALGEVNEVFAYLRNEVRKATGLDLFLVADEAYYQVLFTDDAAATDQASTKPRQRLGAVGEINWERLRAFDGITSYNPYETSRPLYGGEEGAELFLTDVQKMYRQWAEAAASANLVFIPTALPGYNDRGVRLIKDHYVVPRRIGSEWFLSKSLNSWVKPFLDHRAPFAAITSWNEWNEGSAIEPSNLSEATVEDGSLSGHDYTDEQFVEGYGCSMLDVTAEFVGSLDNPTKSQ